jgi:hypothetical protein
MRRPLLALTVLAAGWVAALWVLAALDPDDEAHRRAWLDTLPGASKP